MVFTDEERKDFIEIETKLGNLTKQEIECLVEMEKVGLVVIFWKTDGYYVYLGKEIQKKMGSAVPEPR